MFSPLNKNEEDVHYLLLQ